MNPADQELELVLRQGLQELAGEAAPERRPVGSPRVERLPDRRPDRRPERRSAGRRVLAPVAAAVLLAGAVVGFDRWADTGTGRPPAGTNPVPSLSPAPTGGSSPTGGPSTRRSPSPTTGSPVTRTSAGTSTATEAPTVAGDVPLRVSLAMRIPKQKAPAGYRLISYRISWSGGDAPAYQATLLDEQGKARARTDLAWDCTSAGRDGAFSGTLLWRPGVDGDTLTALVRVRRCDGAIQRATATEPVPKP